MFKLAAVAFSSVLVGQVLGHGILSSPLARQAGDSFEANCGEQMYYNVASDPAGNIQQLNQLKTSSFNAASCNLYLCKGLQFADVPAANIQSWTPGQVIPIKVEIRAPHTGTANVSIVDTATNTMLSTTLAYFPVYASNSAPIPANQTSFSVTLPTNLGSKCAMAGACVLQWWWDSRAVDQTYEACVDFTMSGSGSVSPAAVSDNSNHENPGSTTPAPSTGSGCDNIQARQIIPSAKQPRCGGFGGSTACPDGLACNPYNKYNSACS